MNDCTIEIYDIYILRIYTRGRTPLGITYNNVIYDRNLQLISNYLSTIPFKCSCNIEGKPGDVRYILRYQQPYMYLLLSRFYFVISSFTRPLGRKYSNSHQSGRYFKGPLSSEYLKSI